jgi:hypothetical protein
MTARELPANEWHRLKGTEMEGIVPYLPRDNATVLVIEEGDMILGCWSVFPVLHVEGVWIHPEHRGKGRVAANLWRAMSRLVHRLGGRSAVTHSRTPEITQLITRRGAKPLDGTAFVLPFSERPARIRLTDAHRIGAKFHALLEAQTGEAPHPPDLVHDEAVGRAMTRAFLGNDPDGAVAAYNDWARASGYQPVTYLGRDGDAEVIEMDGQRVAVRESDLCLS